VDLAMADLLSLSSFLFSIITFFYFFSVHVHGDNFTQSSITQINYDLYHSSRNLMDEIKDMVHRHPDRLSMETVKAGNKGYGAEIAVVTYCKGKKDSPEKPKLRILLMIPCLPEFWTAWKGADYLRTCF
jgi:hypothetical protein